MFTGIIEEIGTIQVIKHGSHHMSLKVKAKKVLQDTAIGDSIATNGVCLTVTKIDEDSFTADVMHETLKRTNMKDLIMGSLVNLERALQLSDRLGGHMVSGHIDGTGSIKTIRKDDIAYIVAIKTTEDVLRYIIPKGSIAIDGISLTVTEVAHDSFNVSIIPYTKKDTTLLTKTIGDVVNLECDIIGKYVEKLLGLDGKPRGLTEEMLKKYGY